MASAARKAAEAALAEWEVESERAHSARRQAALYACVKALRAILAEQDGAGAKPSGCLCRCPETPGTHTATRCWDPAPSPAGDEVAYLRDQIAARESTIATLNESLARAITASDEVREAAEYIARCAGCGRDSCDEFENCRRFDGMDHETLVLTCAEDTRKARALLAALSRDAKGGE